MISPYVFPGTFRELPTPANVPSPYTRYATMKQVIKIVSKYYNVDPLLLNTTSRRRDIVKARHMCWYMFKLHCHQCSLKTSARAFGTFDHTTVLHGLQTMQNRIDTDPLERAQLDELSQMIHNVKHHATIKQATFINNPTKGV